MAKLLLINLKKILHSNFFVLCFLLCVLYVSFIRIQLGKTSVYSKDTNEIVGMVTQVKQEEEYTVLEIKAEEKIQAFIPESLSIPLGSKVKVEGTFALPDKNTTKGLFNYRNYLLSRGIVWTIEVEKIQILSEKTSFLLFVKDQLSGLLKTRENSEYYQMIIFGDSSSIPESFEEAIRTLGISHLFALSGSHLTFISFFLFYLLRKVFDNEKKVYLIVCVLLFGYVSMTNFSVSLIRSYVFFVLFKANRLYHWNFKNTTLFFYILGVFLLYHPWWIYDLGFQYSFLICFYLLVFSKWLSSSNYLISVFKISTMAFLVSAPISMFHFYELHLLSIFWNLLFVPFFTFIIFPICFLSFICPLFDPVFSFLVSLLEIMVSQASSIPFGYLVWMRLPLVWYLLLEVFIYFSFQGILRKNYFYVKVTFLFFLLHFIFPTLRSSATVTFFDVGQGDSTIIVLPRNEKVIMIDTGVSTDGKRMSREIIPYLKSLGCRKVDSLILTHGDYDHMGEAINLVENFKVEKVIFNCGEYNDLEKELIKVLDKKKIPYYSCIKELNIDKNKLYFLQTKEYDNENDNSNVIYTELNGYKFMFMGDASSTTEYEILNEYNLPDIDVLKVGHHGSKTSSSEEFINEIKPKYSIISVGKNNRYGHPNKEVLNNLKDSKIYRTDEDGSVMFKIKNNKLKIETCVP